MREVVSADIFPPHMSPNEHEIMRAVEDGYWWYRALRDHVAECVATLGPSVRLLDAGCGSGGMLAVLRERFPDAQLTGIDVSERALELTSARETGATLARGSVNELPFADASFDCVLSLDVLTAGEANDVAALTEMHRVLRPGGMLILNAAAFEFLRGAHDTAVDVTRRYTRAELRALMQRVHFTVGSATYWNMFLLPAVALWRFATRTAEARHDARSDFRPTPRPLNGLLRALASFELALSRTVPLPFGTSVFLIAHQA